LLGTTPPDPETIENEPKQSWKSVFAGRLLSWGGSYAAFLAMGPKLTGVINDKVGKYATEKWLKLSPHSNPVTVRKWADIAAFDALFTAITSSATYILSRYVAKKDDKKIDAEDEIFEINPVDPHIITREIDRFNNEKKKFSEQARNSKRTSPTVPTPLTERASSSGEFAYSLG